ncbi:MAG: type II toxin-antitoxin system prevent-host-death family antitoxin [Acidimicrobiaceae bacterium]|nr:type II toxin-antitoxin system prevent-host-death family antitoxin [Acidimicrobiaceae bacterium]
MKTIGVRELRQHASRWLRRVAEGETYEITVRGVPVARLSPVVPPGGALEQLIDEGLVNLATEIFDEAFERLGPPIVMSSEVAY